MTENYDFSYTGNLDLRVVRRVMRRAPDGIYDIANGFKSRRVHSGKIESTIIEEKWGDLRGTIKGPIKPENLIE